MVLVNSEYSDLKGGYEIWEHWDQFFIFEIPVYGGEPRFYDWCNSLEFAIDMTKNFT